MELISREAAIAAMKKATKEVGFNPFKVLNEVPSVEAFTEDEINAAIKDKDRACEDVRCRDCDYRRFCDASEIQFGLLVNTYRKRKEEGKCD